MLQAVSQVAHAEEILLLYQYKIAQHKTRPFIKRIVSK